MVGSPERAIPDPVRRHMRVLVLIDGEHQPAVTGWAVDVARERGYVVVAAMFLGGSEKGGVGSLDLGVEVRGSGDDVAGALGRSIARHQPDAVLDLSDEPILDARSRMHLVSIALARGVSYIAADSRFDPPVTGEPLPVPTFAVIGTGKRTGKTAIAGEVARIAAADGRDPVLVAMGRGGPASPRVTLPGEVDLSALLALAASGEHAASDYLEDALTTGVPTVGTRRAGGGLAGAPWVSDVREAASAAARLGRLVILEGSGAAVPSIPWDAGILVAPADLDPELLVGYLGSYRLLLSDLVVVTMGDNPSGPEGFSFLSAAMDRIRAGVPAVLVALDPHPLGEVSGRDVFLTTTASPAAAASQARSLAANHGCRVVGWSARLGDREGLMHDLAEASAFEVLLTEVKAAAVDIACRSALDVGAEVVFMDNRPRVIEGQADLSTLIRTTIDLALTRATERGIEP